MVDLQILLPDVLELGLQLIVQFQLRPYFYADADDLEVLEVCFYDCFVEDVGADVPPWIQRLLAVPKQLEEHVCFVISHICYSVEFQLFNIIGLFAIINCFEDLHRMVPVVICAQEFHAVEPPFAKVAICHGHYYTRLIDNKWIVMFHTASPTLVKARGDDYEEGHLAVEEVVNSNKKRRNHQQNRECDRGN